MIGNRGILAVGILLVAVISVQATAQTTAVPSSTDSDGDGVPDQADDCPAVANPVQADADGDNHGSHCDETRPDVHPAAPERNDGVDNDCNGLIDEGSNQAVFCDPLVCGGTATSRDCFCWPAQELATEYQVVRLFAFVASDPRFNAGSCITTGNSFWSDPALPAPGQAFFYLYHAHAPFVGSWGQGSNGATRNPICAVNLQGVCGHLDSEYRAALYEAKACDSDTQCNLARGGVQPDGLICPCPTAVNAANGDALSTMASLRNLWSVWNCNQFWTCPATLCPVLTGGYCAVEAGRCLDTYW